MRILSVILWTLSSAAMAADQSHDSIMASARQFLASRLPDPASYDIQIRPLDKRVTLPECTQALRVNATNESSLLGNITLTVRCDVGSSWRLFVNAQIHATQTIVVALRALPRGARIQPSDITLLRWPTHQLRGAAFSRSEDVIGLTVRQNVSAQAALTASQLCLICRGDHVQVTAGDERFHVGVAGVAAGSGLIGERMEVINPASKRHVFGVVSGPGHVKIDSLQSIR